MNASESLSRYVDNLYKMGCINIVQCGYYNDLLIELPLTEVICPETVMHMDGTERRKNRPISSDVDDELYEDDLYDE